jgi:hypothetical protein
MQMHQFSVCQLDHSIQDVDFNTGLSPKSRLLVFRFEMQINILVRGLKKGPEGGSSNDMALLLLFGRLRLDGFSLRTSR